MIFESKSFHRLRPEESAARRKAEKEGRIISTRHPSAEERELLIASLKGRNNDEDVVTVESLAVESGIVKAE